MTRVSGREPRRLVAADASPLIGLAVVGAFHVLRQLFEVVIVTRAVLDEVTARPELPGAAELDAAMREGWIRAAPTPAGTWQFPQLGAGEASTLALARERDGAPLVLMDDALGCAEAGRLGIEAVGLSDLLLAAKRAGLVASLRPVLERLGRKGFTLAADVVRAVLDEAGEGVQDFGRQRWTGSPMSNGTDARSGKPRAAPSDIGDIGDIGDADDVGNTGSAGDAGDARNVGDAGDTDAVETTTELVALARARLSAPAWDFIVGGAETETTILRNRYALDAIAFRPRVLRDVSAAEPRTTFLGVEQRLPVLLAPLASATDIHPEGALPVARAAAKFGCVMMLSSVAHTELEEVARVAGERLVFQLYADGDEAWVLDMTQRAIDAGCKALCVTVDVPTFGRRERGLHRRQALAGRPFGALRSGEGNRGKADWSLIERVRSRTDLPLIVKGIQTAEDAALALEHGVDVIYVSNHGGRQLDHCCGAVDLLSEIRNAVRGKAEVVVDGGFMRGTDVLKALARGAAMVGLGRLQALALGAAGEAGVQRMLEILETELRVAMKLLGVNRCAELDGTYLQPAPPVVAPGLLSSFPLLDVVR